MKIILGSKSPGRRKLFEEAGFDFEVMPADIDEKTIRTDDHVLLPQLIAQAKNDALAKEISEPTILVTADTVTIYRGELREKPESIEQAREYLRSYEPRTPVTVVSAVVVKNLANGKLAKGYTTANLYFKKFDETTIEHIVTEGYVLGAAGAFAVELPIFDSYIDHIDGEAETSVGTSITLVKRLIKEVTP
jgi:septum formation protein